MTTAFEKEKNRKALLYTVGICGVLLLLMLLISWKNVPPPEIQLPDEIEVNLGNDDEGFGEEQPLIKGERSPEPSYAEVKPQPAAPKAEEKIEADANAEEDAAVVAPKVKSPAPAKPNPVAAKPAPKPQKPKLVYTGPGKGGGNADTDNGYKMQGRNPNGSGDYGNPSGDKDSYGNTPGGRKGGPRVISGNRVIVRSYSFFGDLPKATINAVIRVSPAGTGTFVRLTQGSTSYSNGYATAIIGYLKNIQFDKAEAESQVTVQFNFTVN